MRIQDMAIFKKQTRQETIIYTIVWTLFFLGPIVSMLFSKVATSNVDMQQQWHELLATWAMLLTFLVVFLIHNHILAPLIIHERRTTIYLIATVAMIAIFQLYQCSHRPSDMPREGDGGPYHSEMILPDTSQAVINNDDLDQDIPPEEAQRLGISPRPMGRPPRPMGPPPDRGPIDAHAIIAFVILIMMLGANLGIKFYFNSQSERQRLAELRQQTLKQELDFLRYQVNPHFFMNTLNNIHALVDIDPEQAKSCIVSLSKMMRYLLYEANKDEVSLQSGVEFLKRYVELMRIRFSDKVSINMDLPSQSLSNIMVMPLVFIPFVENAFKHGVSYAKLSVIDIAIKVNGNHVDFRCQNTKNSDTHEHGGVGISNVIKRLDLIYGKGYTLNINDGDRAFDVELSIPYSSNN